MIGSVEPIKIKDLTLERLLLAAVEVFAEQGFRSATIREICGRAKVNVASVNYYFRSKEALYSKALAFSFEEANKLYPQNEASNVSLPPSQRLQFFVENFLHKLLDDSRLGWHGKLISREISEPTKALDDVIKTAIVPNCDLLQDIIFKILGDSAETTLVRRCVLSILGQCLMFKHSRSIIDRLNPDLIADNKAIQESADHIVRFTLAALYGLAQHPTSTGQ